MDKLYFKCKYCDNWEEHPVNEQLHHIQGFEVENIIDYEDERIAYLTCLECDKKTRFIISDNTCEIDDEYDEDAEMEYIENMMFPEGRDDGFSIDKFGGE